MTVTVLLARHAVHADVGRVLSGRGGGALTAEGRGQAAALADRIAHRLDGRAVAALHASPQLRTRETAAIVADRIGAAVRIVPALDEIDFGAWTGRAFAELDDDPAWDAWNRHRATACPPGGEPMDHAIVRAFGYVRAATRALDDGSVLICVTHCDIVRGVIARVLGLDIDNLLRFDIHPASISALQFADWGERVLSVNEGPP